MLLEHGANTETRDRDFYTPLYRAAQNSHTAVALLLDQGKADIDAANRWRWSTLAEACVHANLELVKGLLLRGASTSVRTSDVLTPLDIEKKINHHAIVESLTQSNGSETAAPVE